MFSVKQNFSMFYSNKFYNFSQQSLYIIYL